MLTLSSVCKKANIFCHLISSKKNQLHPLSSINYSLYPNIRSTRPSEHCSFTGSGKMAYHLSFTRVSSVPRAHSLGISSDARNTRPRVSFGYHVPLRKLPALNCSVCDLSRTLRNLASLLRRNANHASTTAFCLMWQGASFIHPGRSERRMMSRSFLAVLGAPCWR